jgi:hypothetical protein
VCGRPDAAQVTLDVLARMALTSPACFLGISLRAFGAPSGPQATSNKASRISQRPGRASGYGIVV